MEHFSSNGLVIIGSVIVIISYLFNLVAKRYSIPSVLLLILLGALLHGLVSATGIPSPELTPVLEVLGIIGLIMIVLEASLDLELTGDKRRLISRVFFTTLESFFIVRTFFFVIFGFTIVLNSLLDLKVWMVSILILAILYGIRFAYFILIIRKNILLKSGWHPGG